MRKNDAAALEQVAVFGCERIELGVLDPEKDQMQIRPVQSAELARMLPWLRWANANGRHIYVRPAGEHRMTLVDDLSAEAIMQMQIEGFEPAFVVETSPDNFQAWLANELPMGNELATRVARIIALRFDGDVSSADWRHFGRLAGFTNRKPKYMDAAGRFPFVKACPVPAPEHHYSEAATVRALAVQELAHERAVEAQERAQRLADARRYAPRKDDAPLPIERFWQDPRYGGDFNRADLAWCVHALGRGASVSWVESQLGGRDLAHKGGARRRQDYIERTVKKALANLSR